MKYEKEIAEIRTRFLSLINKYRTFEKMPHHYGTGEILYPAELVTIETIGAFPKINVTELAHKHGVTKGAVSQTLAKLERKKLVQKSKSPTNHKETLLKLTVKGEIAYHQHQLFHLQIDAGFFEETEHWTPEQIKFLLHVFTRFNEMLDKAFELMKDEI